MSIFHRRKNETTQETVPTTYTIQDLNNLFDNSDIKAALGESNLCAATYYAAMQIRCNALAKIPFKVYKQSGDGAEVIQHNITELLRFRPNPFTSIHDFLWATEFQRIQYGNAYWVYNFVRGKIKEIYLLDSTKVTVIVDNSCLLSKNNAVYYKYVDEKSGEIIYPADKVVHFKSFAMNGLKGTPMSKYMADVINQEKYSQKVVKGKYENGLQDPLIVVYTGDLDNTRQAKIKQKFENLGGPQNAGKVVPIPSDFDVKTLETKLVNSQFFQLNGLTTRHIANAFGVKSFQLNDMEKSTYSNIEQQNKAFYSDTMQNVLTEYEQEITYKMLSTADRNNGIYVKANADVMLRSDLTERYNAYATGISSGFITIAEARKKEDLPHVEGTDSLIIGNGASIPLEQLGNQYNAGGKGGE